MFFEMANDDWLRTRMLFLIPLLLSLSVHEWAHAWSAWKLGDDTAARQGRLSLNPMVHIDPIGTVLLPMLGVPFGWAKPVPINPGRFVRTVSVRTGVLLTAAAGPVSNLCLAFGCLCIQAVLISVEIEVAPALSSLLHTTIFLNVILAVCNALPIPPLDGGRIADALMPDSLRPMWDGFSRLGPLALIGVIVLPTVFGISLVGWAFDVTQVVQRQMVWILSL